MTANKISIGIPKPQPIAMAVLMWSLITFSVDLITNCPVLIVLVVMATCLWSAVKNFT